MNEVFALALKDIRLLLRDKSGFFFTFFFPIIVAVFFGAIFSGSGGGSRSMELLIIDEDQTEESREFIGHLEKADEIRVEMSGREEATEKVRLGSATAYIALPEGFGEARKNLFWGGPPEIELGVDPGQKATAGMLHGILMKYGVLGFQKAFSNPSVMRQNVGEILPLLDETDEMRPEMKHYYKNFLTGLHDFMTYLDENPQTQAAETLADEAAETLADEAAETLADEADQPADMPEGLESGVTGPLSKAETASGPSIETVTAGNVAETGEDASEWGGFQPLVIRNNDVIRERKGPSSGYAVSFPQGIMWGILGCAAGFGISLVVERSRGTLIRLRSAPISLMQILSGKALACFMTTIAISFGLALLAATVFHVEPSSYLLLAMALVSSCIGFVGIMMLLSVLGKTEQSAGGIGWAILMVMSMLGGGMIPRFIMPQWMQTLSHISPVKWAMLAMEGAIWRQFTFVEMLKPCSVIIGVGLLCFTIGVRVFSRTIQD